MSGYTPVFDSMLDGSLFGRWPHTGIWACLMSKVSREGTIDISPEMLAAAIGVTKDTFMACIEDFMRPDPNSRTPDFEGRRLELIDPARPWGWRVLNAPKYREKARKKSYDAERTASGQDAARKREQRAFEKPAEDVPRCPAMSRRVPLSESYSDTDSNTKNPPISPLPGGIRGLVSPSGQQTGKPKAAAQADPDEFATLKRVFPKRAGDQPWRDALQCCNARLKEGHTWEEIIAGALRYEAFCSATGKVGTETVMQAKRFCGPNKPFLNAWTLPDGGGPNAPTKTRYEQFSERLKRSR